MPSGTAFSLKWSPWVVEGQTRTATLAYIAPNYVGFRRVSLIEEWHRGEQPNLEVEGSDTISSCLFLSSDAFVDFEDKVCSFTDSINDEDSLVSLAGLDK